MLLRAAATGKSETYHPAAPVVQAKQASMACFKTKQIFLSGRTVQQSQAIKEQQV
jgi:hypothetical protein